MLLKTSNYLNRYLAVEYQATSELSARGDLRDPSLVNEAEELAVIVMERVIENLSVLTPNLEAMGYPFYQGYWLSPSLKIFGVIGKLQEVVGGPIPVSLRTFWSVVGEVNLAYDLNKRPRLNRSI